MRVSGEFILLGFVSFFILISCAQNPVSTQTPSFISKIDKESSVTPSPPPVATNRKNLNFEIPFPAHATPDNFQRIFDDTSQVTDGKLKLHLFNSQENDCYRNSQSIPEGDGTFRLEFGEAIPLVLTFENITDEEIKIVDYISVVSPGNYITPKRALLTPILGTLEGQRIREAVEFYSEPFKVYATLEPPVVQVIPAKSTFQTQIDYLPPIFGVAHINELGELDFADFPAGKYLVKYVYFSNNNDNMWNGLVSSNQVQVCFYDG